MSKELQADRPPSAGPPLREQPSPLIPQSNLNSALDALVKHAGAVSAVVFGRNCLYVARAGGLVQVNAEQATVAATHLLLSGGAGRLAERGRSLRGGVR